MNPDVVELVRYVASAIVDEPDEVEVTQEDPHTIMLRVAPDDRGKVIGRKGRTAHAMRALLGCCTDQSVTLDILD